MPIIPLKVLPNISGNPMNLSNSTYLGELDDFSLMGIFDRLHVGDLSKLAAMNPRFRQLIIDHYIIGEQRLHECDICIDLDEQISMSSKVSDVSKVYMSENLEEILSILQNFGGIFKKLNIFIDQHGYKHVEEVQQAINKYCSSASQEVRLVVDYADKNSTLGDNVNVSFLNATDITLLRFAGVGVGPIRLDTAFPRMQKITTNSEIDLNHHYQHLNEAKFVSFHLLSDISKLLQFFRLNSQLLTIESPLFNQDTFLNIFKLSTVRLITFVFTLIRGFLKYSAY